MPKIEEEWKPLANWEDSYEVSDYGRVRSVGRTILRPYLTTFRKKVVHPKILTKTLDEDGYYRVCLSRNGKSLMYRIHILVFKPL